MAKRPVKQKLFPVLPPVAKNNLKDPVLQVDDEMVTNNFESGSKDDFNIICNVISVLRVEFDFVIILKEL